MSPRPRPRRGFTAMEAVVAIAVVAAAVVPAMGMWEAAGQAAMATERRARALAIGAQVIETSVRGVAFDALPTTELTGQDAPYGLSWRLTITTLSPGLKRAEVAVGETGASPLVRLTILTAQED